MSDVIDVQTPKISWEAVKDYCEDIITIKDLEMNYVACNKAFENLIHLSENDVINKNVYDVLPYESAKASAHYTRELLKTGQTQTFLLRIEQENKPVRFIRQTSTLISKDGKVTGILSVSRDVTVEENLKSELVDANTKFNILLEHIPMVVYMKDAHGNNITSSKYAKSFIEKGIEPYVGNLKIELTETAEQILKEDKYVIENNESIVVEKTSTDSKGVVHWYRVVKVPITNEGADINSLVTIVQNIDHEKQNQEKKKKQNAKPKFNPNNRKLKCADGDIVRSKAEREIDDFLYYNNIKHEYESEYYNVKRNQKTNPDFYLPQYNLYIEYFGMNTPKYNEMKAWKLELYSSDHFTNFEYIDFKDDNNLIDKLRSICKKYNIPLKGENK